MFQNRVLVGGRRPCLPLVNGLSLRATIGSAAISFFELPNELRLPRRPPRRTPRNDGSRDCSTSPKLWGTPQVRIYAPVNRKYREGTIVNVTDRKRKDTAGCRRCAIHNRDDQSHHATSPRKAPRVRTGGQSADGHHDDVLSKPVCR